MFKRIDFGIIDNGIDRPFRPYYNEKAPKSSPNKGSPIDAYIDLDWWTGIMQSRFQDKSNESQLFPSDK